jgi:hypothetical protein
VNFTKLKVIANKLLLIGAAIIPTRNPETLVGLGTDNAKHWASVAYALEIAVTVVNRR